MVAANSEISAFQLFSCKKCSNSFAKLCLVFFVCLVWLSQLLLLDARLMAGRRLDQNRKVTGCKKPKQWPEETPARSTVRWSKSTQWWKYLTATQLSRNKTLATGDRPLTTLFPACGGGVVQFSTSFCFSGWKQEKKQKKRRKSCANKAKTYYMVQHHYTKSSPAYGEHHIELHPCSFTLSSGLLPLSNSTASQVLSSLPTHPLPQSKPQPHSLEKVKNVMEKGRLREACQAPWAAFHGATGDREDEVLPFLIRLRAESITLSFCYAMALQLTITFGFDESAKLLSRDIQEYFFVVVAHCCNCYYNNILCFTPQSLSRYCLSELILHYYFKKSVEDNMIRNKKKTA